MTQITILTTDEYHIATKTFEKKDGVILVKGYRSGSYFVHRCYEDAENIDDLYILLQAMEASPRSMLIRGRVKDEFISREQVTRTLHDFPERRQVGMIEPIPDGAEWMMCDFDGAKLPEGMSYEAGLEMLIHQLPAEFHDVSYCYQLSSSCGVEGIRGNGKRTGEHFPGKAGISAHIFFWLDKPTPNMARWGKNFNAHRKEKIIDPAPLETVQPNYMAKPAFVNMDDPLGDRRHGIVHKSKDAVPLVWIDPPVEFVTIREKKVEVGRPVEIDGVQRVANRSLQDRIDNIGKGWRGRREDMKDVLGYYFWLYGDTGSRAEIKTMVRAAHPDVKDRCFDDLAAWYQSRHNHPPNYVNKDDAILARWAARPAPDADDDDEIPNELADWLFDMDDIGLRLQYIEDTCGAGKTEWLINQIGSIPDRYIVALPRIDMVREVAFRLNTQFPNIEESKGYLIETIYTNKENDIRDTEDKPDDQLSTSLTVGEQIARFRKAHGERKHVVLFVTHAALVLVDWWQWTDYHLIVDEIFEPYASYSRNFKNNSALVRRMVEVGEGGETNYHRLALTLEGERKVSDSSYDEFDEVIRGLMESMNTRNTSVFALRAAWEAMAEERVQLMRLTDARLLAPFKTATIMGDEFNRSLLAMTFAGKYGVELAPHPRYRSSHVRRTPLNKRARIFFFASKEQRRGSIKNFDETKVIGKILKWMNENLEAQTICAANRKYEGQFDKPGKEGLRDAWNAETRELERSMTGGKAIKVLYLPPRMAGTNVYRDMSSVAFLAAMRPGFAETEFVGKSLLIDEEEIIRWREYNPLYQFVMRGNLRKFESDELCNIYVYDEFQAEYLRERFGGALTCQHIKGVVEDKTPAARGGRPKGSTKTTSQTGAERKRKMRERRKAEAGTRNE